MSIARTLVAAGFAALVLASAGVDLAQGLRSYDRLAPLAPGKPVPPFDVLLLDGGRFAQADLAGRVHVVTFWATWCPYCRDELDELDAMIDDYDPSAVAFLAVNREGGGLSLDEVRGLTQRYRASTKLRVPIALDDGRMARAFGVGPIPHTAIFDREGKLRRVHQGRVSGETIADDVAALLRESPPG